MAPEAEEAEGLRDLEGKLRENLNWWPGWTAKNLDGSRDGEEDDDAPRRVMERGLAWRTASIGRRGEIAGSDGGDICVTALTDAQKIVCIGKGEM